MGKTQLTIRLTSDNVTTSLLPGDVFTEDPEFGTVTNVWVTSAGAKIHTDRETDTLYLPQTVKITRDA